MEIFFSKFRKGGIIQQQLSFNKIVLVLLSVFKEESALAGLLFMMNYCSKPSYNYRQKTMEEEVRKMDYKYCGWF